jgi:site-specific recombinase XerD
MESRPCPLVPLAIRLPPPPSPPLRAPRLLDHVRERIRYHHYSLKTEKSYVHWVRRFVHFHGLRHPRDMGGPEVEAFLAHLANSRQVSSSTHHQALCALLYLYRRVLGVELPWMQSIGRPRRQARIPVVLSHDEVARLFAALPPGEPPLLPLLYGAGLRMSGIGCFRPRRWRSIR